MMQAGQHEATGNPIADSATGVLPREGEAPAEPACGTGLCGIYEQASVKRKEDRKRI